MPLDEISIGRTGSAVYTLCGAWVYHDPSAHPYRYDTLEGFVTEMLIGALGGSWRETPDGTRIINRVVP
ncbi:hypothetical protein GGE65_008198 [Skermanella aerolata]|uniref:hypothetical protein n=1 Tax=Skermanella aerolata TaxID=393310 RepID=UPI003D194C7B